MARRGGSAFSTSSEAEKREPMPEPGHVHHWWLDAPADGVINGECYCGARREFPAAPPVEIGTLGWLDRREAFAALFETVGQGR